MKPDLPASGTILDEADLLRRARELKARSYSPYSNFRVGAVVVTADGHRFEGVNVENASYRLTTCAEQSAIAGMITAGVRSDIVAVATVGDGQDPCTPCGACRQTIFEFGPDATIYASGDGGQPLIVKITELLPHAFGPQRLSQGQS
jgi:cytidine deaminase